MAAVLPWTRAGLGDSLSVNVHKMNTAFNLRCKPTHCQEAVMSEASCGGPVDTGCGACHIFDHDVRNMNESNRFNLPNRRRADIAGAPLSSNWHDLQGSPS